MIDSPFLSDLYGTPELRGVFSSAATLQRWLDVEAALAQAEGELGVIPAGAAEDIVRAARADNVSWEAIAAGVADTVHPIVPVIRALQAACPGDSGEYIHWGATTQDIMDTALVLQLQQAVPLLDGYLQELEDGLARLARRHRDTLLAGRTHGQHALPVTLGYKAAIWLAEVRRHRLRLEQLRPRLLVGQLGGAVGTLASLGDQATAVQRRTMQILGLQTPEITWHTSRDAFGEYGGWCALAAATAGKIAHEVITLQRTEIAELEEPFHAGKIGSSTMPHKRNPMLCEAVLALARLVLRLAPALWDAMLQENERDWSSDHIEWAVLPEISIYTGGALAQVGRVIAGLHVDPERMRRNLDLTRGMVLSEAVMLALSPHIGRQTAHEVVYRCAQQAHREGRAFGDVLSHDPAVSARLSPAEIEALLDPTGYTGLAGEFVDRMIGE